MKCTECTGRCNKKGYPSISKYSMYCDDELGISRWIFKKHKNKKVKKKSIMKRFVRTIKKVIWK